MSYTYTNLLTHFVFSTKDRIPLINDEIKPELHAYLSGLVKELKGKLIKINGMNDHIHILASLPPTVSISDAMRFIKANSSKWVSEKFNKPFEWQKGTARSASAVREWMRLSNISKIRKNIIKSSISGKNF